MQTQKTELKLLSKTYIFGSKVASPYSCNIKRHTPGLESEFDRALGARGGGAGGNRGENKDRDKEQRGDPKHLLGRKWTEHIYIYG